MHCLDLGSLPLTRLETAHCCHACSECTSMHCFDLGSLPLTCLETAQSYELNCICMQILAGIFLSTAYGANVVHISVGTFASMHGIHTSGVVHESDAMTLQWRLLSAGGMLFGSLLFGFRLVPFTGVESLASCSFLMPVVLLLLKLIEFCMPLRQLLDCKCWPYSCECCLPVAAFHLAKLEFADATLCVAGGVNCLLRAQRLLQALLQVRSFAAVCMCMCAGVQLAKMTTFRSHIVLVMSVLAVTELALLQLRNSPITYVLVGTHVLLMLLNRHWDSPACLARLTHAAVCSILC